MVPFRYFLRSCHRPIPVRYNWSVFARKMHSTSEFAMIVLSKCVKDGVWQSCVWKMVCDKEWCDKVVCSGRRSGRRRRGGIQNQKQEPHTKMWGKTDFAKDGFWLCAFDDPTVYRPQQEPTVGTLWKTPWHYQFCINLDKLSDKDWKHDQLSNCVKWVEQVFWTEAYRGCLWASRDLKDFNVSVSSFFFSSMSLSASMGSSGHESPKNKARSSYFGMPCHWRSGSPVSLVSFSSSAGGFAAALPFAAAFGTGSGGFSSSAFSRRIRRLMDIRGGSTWQVKSLYRRVRLTQTCQTVLSSYFSSTALLIPSDSLTRFRLKSKHKARAHLQSQNWNVWTI